MANRIAEVGLFVVADRSPVSSLHGVGLLVLHDSSIPAPEARLRGIGMMVLHLAPPASTRGGVQGRVLGPTMSVQGNSVRWNFSFRMRT